MILFRLCFVLLGLLVSPVNIVQQSQETYCIIGLGIETKKIRRWLAASTFTSVSLAKVEQEAVAEPPSYSASFNPFPALVIGVTGAAMSAHAQRYLFQVCPSYNRVEV